MAATAGSDHRADRLQAFFDARDAGDVEELTVAALRLPSAQRFGADAGQIPALIHEALVAATSDRARARLAAALARALVYGNDAARARSFADQALDLAEQTGEASIIADALDSALVSRWGPDDFGERVRLATRLADTTAYLTDIDLRLSAHLWRLTTAWESLDIVTVQRQLRALDVLADDTGDQRVAFFAASRRAMHLLVTGDLDTADAMIGRTAELGAGLAEPDLEAVHHSLGASRARLAGDVDTLRSEAAAFDAHGAAEGIPSVLAESAVLWLAAGELGRAGELLEQLTDRGVGAIVRDVDFLLTTTSLVEVACAVGADDVVAEGAALLEPYAGRGVLNAGAVTFHGVVDDYLHHAHRALGHDTSPSWGRSAVASYQRIGATWWQRRIQQPATRTLPPPQAVVHLHTGDGDLWTFGHTGSTVTLPPRLGFQYLRLLLQRPRIDVPAATLSSAARGDAAPERRPDRGIELLDPQALERYRRRLRDLDTETAEAEAWADEGRLELLRNEREALLHEVGRATGLHGAPRHTGGTDERARTAVRKAIAAALSVMERHDPTIARLLRDTVRTGTTCRYDPDPSRPITWVLDDAG